MDKMSPVQNSVNPIFYGVKSYVEQHISASFGSYKPKSQRGEGIYIATLGPTWEFQLIVFLVSV